MKIKQYEKSYDIGIFETEKYYKIKGLQVRRDALGSQDGEYVELLNDSILYLLDPSAIGIWEESQDIEEFLKKYKKFLDKIQF